MELIPPLAGLLGPPLWRASAGLRHSLHDWYDPARAAQRQRERREYEIEHGAPRTPAELAAHIREQQRIAYTRAAALRTRLVNPANLDPLAVRYRNALPGGAGANNNFVTAIDTLLINASQQAQFFYGQAEADRRKLALADKADRITLNHQRWLTILKRYRDALKAANKNFNLDQTLINLLAQMIKALLG